jgi:hypothetical protein
VHVRSMKIEHGSLVALSEERPCSQNHDGAKLLSSHPVRWM